MPTQSLGQIDRYIASMGKYLWNPCLWAREVCRYQIDPWQEDYLNSMLSGQFTAVSGSNGSGKDFISSLFALFLLSTRPLLKGQVTGPNKDQIFDVVWAEAHKLLYHSPVLPTILRWEKTHIRNRLAPEEWFLVAKTASKRFSTGGGDAQSEGIQGIRGLYTLVLITEASGVEDPNFEAARSCCATHNAFLGLVGNPLRRSGFFYRIFNDDQFKDWKRIYVAYTDSSWTDKAQMAQWIKEYGAESNYCTARCFGQFPKHGAEDTCISWALVKAAQMREAPLLDDSFLQIGVDPARHGDDEAVIAVRKGYWIPPLKILKTCTSGQLLSAIHESVVEFGGDQDTLILVDESGMGGLGCVDPLREGDFWGEGKGYKNVVGCQNISRAVRPDKYNHWDTEQWLDSMPAFFESAVLPHDEQLLTELTVRRWKFTGKNNKQQRLETKDELKKRGFGSPGRAEAVMLACAPDPRTAADLDLMLLNGDKELSEDEQAERGREVVEAAISRDGVYFP